MTFNEYQDKSKETVLDPSFDKLEYYALGLAGESGEVVEKIKKLWRDRDFAVDDEFREMLAGEMGDVLWYMSQIARVAGIELDTVAASSITKITSRMNRDVIHGDGDTR